MQLSAMREYVRNRGWEIAVEVKECPKKRVLTQRASKKK
jgi:hypothetical protein